MTKQKVIFFVGGDLTSALIINRVVSCMMNDGRYQPILYYPKYPKSEKANLPALREFGFFDRKILESTVYPFLQEKPGLTQKIYSPQQILALHQDKGLEVHSIDKVNDEAFVNTLENDPSIAAVISIRCFQKFGPSIITKLSAKGLPFLNLHPGLLPEYRGVMSTFRRMFDIATGAADSNDYGCTLHKVTEELDRGNVVNTHSRRLTEGDTGYMANLRLSAGAANMIKSVILDGLANGDTFRGTPQDSYQTEKNYYSYPDEATLSEWKDSGIVLFNRNEVRNTLVQEFSKAGSGHATSLLAAIDSAIDAWYAENPDVIPSGIEQETSGIVVVPANYNISSEVSLQPRAA